MMYAGAYMPLSNEVGQIIFYAQDHDLKVSIPCGMREVVYSLCKIVSQRPFHTWSIHCVEVRDLRIVIKQKSLRMVASKAIAEDINLFIRTLELGIIKECCNSIPCGLIPPIPEANLEVVEEGVKSISLCGFKYRWPEHKQRPAKGKGR